MVVVVVVVFVVVVVDDDVVGDVVVDVVDVVDVVGVVDVVVFCIQLELSWAISGLCWAILELC